MSKELTITYAELVDGGLEFMAAEKYFTARVVFEEAARQAPTRESETWCLEQAAECLMLNERAR